MSRTRGLDIAIREYRDEDEAQVLELLGTSLGGGPAGERPAEFFRWKHVENPFGRSFMLVAEDDERIIGLRAFMRWRFACGGRNVDAVRAVDTATHPDYQGRGVFSHLTLAALDALRGDVDLVFNTPNDKSLPGYLKMGWRTVGTVPVSIRVRRPVRFASGLRSVRSQDASPTTPVRTKARPAAEVLADDEPLAGLLAEADEPAGRLSTRRDIGYLRWRYGAAPLLDYRSVLDEEGDRVRGLAVFRVRPRGRLWETTISEIIVRPGDFPGARRLLGCVVRAAAVDHLTCHFAPGSAPARAALSRGFIRWREGMTFVINPLREPLSPDPEQLGSWGLTLGDLEVF